MFGTYLCKEDSLEKEMAIHWSILAWEIPWTKEPGGLQSMESRRVRYGLVTTQHQWHTKKLFVGYLKFKFNCHSVLLFANFSNPTQHLAVTQFVLLCPSTTKELWNWEKWLELLFLFMENESKSSKDGAGEREAEHLVRIDWGSTGAQCHSHPRHQGTCVPPPYPSPLHH